MMNRDLQSKLERVRPPRVHITYDVETAGAIESRELPFVIGVLSSVSGRLDEPLPPLKSRNFIDIDFDNFNHVLAAFRPRLAYRVENLLTDDGGTLAGELRFSEISDFEPRQIIRQVKPLEDLLQTRATFQTKEELANLDALLSRQLNLIMHDPAFQELEASWRGLHYLVSKSETGVMVRIRVLNVSKKELLKDLERAIEVDHSVLYKKVYEDEYGTVGGAPYGALIGDYYFSNHPQDIALLEGLANLANLAQAPFIASASPDMFGWDTFADITTIRDLSKIFDRTEYAKWRSFRESEDSRYVALTLPRVLLRPPYVPRVSSEGEFQFAEELKANGESYLFGNGAYAFGTCLTNAFAKYHWLAEIRGVDGGGVISGLPVWDSMNDHGEPAYKSPVEIAITDRLEKEFSDLGFITLLHYRGTDYAVIFAATSCSKPRKYDSDVANMNERWAGQLQYLLTTSRFGHYIKCIARDMIGSFVPRGDLERHLNRWISNYVTHSEQVSPAGKAQFPLREARVDVVEVPENPGHFRAVVFLRPYFQLDELTVSLRFSVDLPIQLRL